MLPQFLYVDRYMILQLLCVNPPSITCIIPKKLTLNIPTSIISLITAVAIIDNQTKRGGSLTLSAHQRTLTVGY